MRRLPVLMLLALSSLAQAAAPVTAPGLSRQFELTAEADAACATEEPQCIAPATLRFRANDGAPIAPLHVGALEFQVDDDGAASVNDTAMYGMQSMFVAGDFDFDGHDDLALRTGDDGPYGGPTYAVYRFEPRARRFVEDAQLGRLTQETLGMFGVDAKRRRITTWAKSGCCWHQYVEYARGPKGLVAVYRRTDDASRAAPAQIEERRDAHGRWHRRVRPLED